MAKPKISCKAKPKTGFPARPLTLCTFLTLAPRRSVPQLPWRPACLVPQLPYLAARCPASSARTPPRAAPARPVRLRAPWRPAGLPPCGRRSAPYRSRGAAAPPAQLVLRRAVTLARALHASLGVVPGHGGQRHRSVLPVVIAASSVVSSICVLCLDHNLSSTEKSQSIFSTARERPLKQACLKRCSI